MLKTFRDHNRIVHNLCFRVAYILLALISTFKSFLFLLKSFSVICRMVQIFVVKYVFIMFKIIM